MCYFFRYFFFTLSEKSTSMDLKHRYFFLSRRVACSQQGYILEIDVLEEFSISLLQEIGWLHKFKHSKDV